uniref:RRM domain-containing protein n=1 Tax=Panagrellus redivivus TaxID=6233 RepID=A0A7E4ZSK1_PANRE
MAFALPTMATDAHMAGQMPQYFYQPAGGDAGAHPGEAITSPPPSMIMTPGTPANNNNNGKGDNYYTVISNRIFVGSLQTEVDEAILKQTFDGEGTIRESKIIRDNAGQSKGFGFITFQDEKDAAGVLEKPSGTYCFKGRTWNVAPAMRRFNNAPRETPVPVPNLLCYSNYPGGLVRYGNGIVAYPNFVPQQIYSSPSPYITSPMMQQHHFVFPSVPQHYDPNGGVTPVGAVNTAIPHQVQGVQNGGQAQQTSTASDAAADNSPAVNPDDFPPLPSKSTSSDPGDLRSVSNTNTTDSAPWQSFRPDL